VAVSETYMLHRVENGLTFTLPDGYKLVEVAQADPLARGCCCN